MTRSASSARALTRMTGMSLVLRRSPSTSSPSRAGIITSSRTRSGFSRETTSSAACPSSASRTSYPSMRSRRERRLRSIGSSSTTRTVHSPITVESLPAGWSTPHLRVVGQDHFGLGRGQIDHDRAVVAQLPVDDEPGIWWKRRLLHMTTSTQELPPPRGFYSPFAPVEEVLHALALVVALEQQGVGGHVEGRGGRPVE